MDYKEMYDKALEKAKRLYGQGTITESLCYVFPELKESEDESIRKELIAFLKENLETGRADETWSMSGLERWIAWLEKQGEQKVFIPKFRIGDIVKSKSQPMLDSRIIISIDKDCYRTNNGGCIGFAWEKDYELIKQKPVDLVAILKDYFANTPKEQQDKDWEELKHLNDIGPDIKIAFGAKDSEDERIRKDLLGYLHTLPNHFSHNGSLVTEWIAWLEKQGDASRTYELGFTEGQRIERKWWLEKQGTPAELSEEEQNRFAKGVLTSCAMSFIDYLDAHKYEGKMCVSNGECEDIENAFHNAMWDRLHRYYCKYIEKQGEQKPTWSEADEDEMAIAIAHLFKDCQYDTVDWLKDLKDRVQPQPRQEWSEEDKRSIRDSIFYLKSAKKYLEKDDDILWDEKWFNLCIERLEALYKRLQPQPQWKPSEEQMKVLDAAVMHSHLTTTEYDGLVKLREQLKKLREE